MNLYIVIGPAGCGKSTYIEKSKSENDIVISSDSIREELFGDASIQSNPQLVFKIFYDRIQEALKAEHNVWADATNLSIKDRKNYNKFIPICDNIETHILVTPFITCIKQNRNRERKVPFNVIRRMFKNIQLPIKSEPYSPKIIYTVDGDYFFEPYDGQSYKQLLKNRQRIKKLII